MKLTQERIINLDNKKHVSFDLTRIEFNWFSELKVKRMLAALSPQYEDLYRLPAIRFIDGQIYVNVDEPLKEKLVKSILIAFAGERFLRLAEMNDIFKSICTLLNVEFYSLTEEANKAYALQCAQSLVSRFLAAPAPAPTQPKEDDFGSGLKGLRGAFAHK